METWGKLFIYTTYIWISKIYGKNCGKPVEKIQIYPQGCGKNFSLNPLKIITKKTPFVKGFSKFSGFRSTIDFNGLGGGSLADLGTLTTFGVLIG